MKKILLVLVVLVLGFVAFVASRPATYHVERSATVAAPPEVVFARITDLHAWQAWSPWEKLDPAMKHTFSGPDRGTGASYAWAGNDKVGEGRMTITDATAPSKVAFELEFIKPFASKCETGFTLAPEGDGTKVTWTMDGKNDFMGKAMCLFMDMDKTVGGDFERGLASLNTVAAADAQAAVAAPDSAHAGAAGK